MEVCPLNTTVTAANYTAQGEVLSPIGTVIALQNPATDQFFLSFDQLGTQTHVVVEPTPVAPTPVDLPPVADVGVRTFAQVNSSLSALTGVPTTQSAVAQTYQAVQQQLPSAPTFEGFLASNQVGVAQLAIQYCNVMVNTPALQAADVSGRDVRRLAVLDAGRHQFGDQRAGRARARHGSQQPAGRVARSPTSSTP